MKSVLAAVAVVAVVGAGTAASVWAGSDDPGGRSDDPAVSCDSGEPQRTPERSEVRVPAFESPIDAARAWAGPDAGRVTVSDDQTTAYLWRADGTVRASMRLDSTRVDLEPGEPTAWSVNGSVACPDEVSAEPWSGAASLDCDEPVVRARVVYPDEGDRRATTAEGAVGLPAFTTTNDVVRLALTSDAKSGDVTATIGQQPHTVVRAIRVSDTWRIEEVASCADRMPGLPRTPDVTVIVPLFVGHCWVEPLSFDGRSWEAPEREQFGSGGGMPESWRGFGTVQVLEDHLEFVDLGGASLTFVPSGSPGIGDRRFCA